MDELIIPIHTSDRLSFKRCRRRWDILSDLRQGRKPISAPRPLEFGSAFHAGMEFFYNPKTWKLTLDERRPVMVAGAIAAFKSVMAEQKQRYITLTGKEGLDDNERAEYEEDLDLGTGMFLHYFDYVKRHRLDRFTPILTEISFEVPIFTEREVATLLPQWTGYKVVYRGRVDALVYDEWQQYWIVDWKTTIRMRDNLAFLELDEQLGSYNWALQKMLGIPIAGNIYAEIRKAYPLPPAENKTFRLGRRFSVNKNQSTSYDLYLQTIKEAGEPVELYEDMLNFLKVEGIEYVRRTQIHRNQYELAEIQSRIRMETLDMLGPNLRIYPSPSPFSCDNCPVRPVCVGMNDGSDVQFILDTYTTKEMRTNV